MMIFGYGSLALGTDCDRCQERIPGRQEMLLVNVDAESFALCHSCRIGAQNMDESEFSAHIASGSPKWSPILKTLRDSRDALYASARRHRVAGDIEAAQECERQAYSASLAAGHLEQQEWSAANQEGTE